MRLQMSHLCENCESKDCDTRHAYRWVAVDPGLYNRFATSPWRSVHDAGKHSYVMITKREVVQSKKRKKDRVRCGTTSEGFTRPREARRAPPSFPLGLHHPPSVHIRRGPRRMYSKTSMVSSVFSVSVRRCSLRMQVATSCK